MSRLFTPTNQFKHDGTRDLLINNERILYMERFEGETVTYTVTFDNGATIDLDERAGQSLRMSLGVLSRPSPPVQYVSSNPLPNNRRRRASL